MAQPWEREEVLALTALLRGSWRRWTGAELLASPPAQDGEAAQMLYQDAAVVLAHDGAADPRFTYANAAAQRLWGIPWGEFIGMPSRLSAEPDQRAERQQLLARAARDGIARDYSGVRIARDGHRFRIEDAVLWNLCGPDGEQVGQAVRFVRWRQL
jgi:PAS domain-containing protein